MKKLDFEPKTFPDYLIQIPTEFRQTLEEMIQLVKDEVPEAEEKISYKIPCFKYLYMMVGVGVTKQKCSFYTMNPELVKSLKEELKDVSYSGSTLHFEPGSELPEELLRKIIRIRKEENELKFQSKKK